MYAGLERGKVRLVRWVLLLVWGLDTFFSTPTFFFFFFFE